jgi:hypothetical protein
MAGAARYLQARDETVAMLNQMKAIGGSGSIDAKSNAIIAAIWEYKRNQIAMTDVNWSQVQDLMFARDDLGMNPITGMTPSDVSMAIGGAQ